MLLLSWVCFVYFINSSPGPEWTCWWPLLDHRSYIWPPRSKTVCRLTSRMSARMGQFMDKRISVRKMKTWNHPKESELHHNIFHMWLLFNYVLYLLHKSLECSMRPQRWWRRGREQSPTCPRRRWQGPHTAHGSGKIWINQHRCKLLKYPSPLSQRRRCNCR